MKLAVGVCVLLFMSAYPIAAQPVQEAPQKTTVCEILNHPQVWNHKLVEVTGFASHGFEDSGFRDPDCPDAWNLWMEYGGKLRTGTMSTASNWDRTGSKPMTVEGIKIALVDDATFHRFDDFLHSNTPSMTVHATVVARFFAGGLGQPKDHHIGGGYGHLGCCALFVIQQVLDVDDHRRPDLDYSGTPEQPDASSYRDLSLASTTAENLRDQGGAEQGERAYAFSDPERVAREKIAAYSPAPKIDPATLNLTKTFGNEYRLIYRATERGSNRRFMVVLSRPYWLSYSAKDPKRVPWVAIAAYEIDGEENTAKP
jgi:hypothetical protein